MAHPKPFLDCPNDTVVLAFDLYGTLLSTASIASHLAQIYGRDGSSALAAKWRTYQLEYTWRANSMGYYVPFSDITERSLIHTIKESRLEISDEDKKKLMEQYDKLSAFPDAQDALENIKKNKDIVAVVFSNGTTEMVNSSVKRSPDLSKQADTFKDIVTIDQVERPVFKPDPKVYLELARRAGKIPADSDVEALANKVRTKEALEEDIKKGLQQLWLVSGNPFDAMGAKTAGLKVCWVDRENRGWVDNLGGDSREARPDRIISDLRHIL